MPPLPRPRFSPVSLPGGPPPLGGCPGLPVRVDLLGGPRPSRPSVSVVDGRTGPDGRVGRGVWGSLSLVGGGWSGRIPGSSRVGVDPSPSVDVRAQVRVVGRDPFQPPIVRSRW